MVNGESIYGSIFRLCSKLFVSNEKSVSFYKLYRYGTCFELFLTFLGIFFGIITGLHIPVGIILYGEFTALLVDRSNQYENSTPTYLLKWFRGGKILFNASREENNEALINDSYAFLKAYYLMCFSQFIFGILCVDLLNYTALKQTTRIRKLFFKCTLGQDMAWYDTHTGINIASNITDDLDKMKIGIGEKVGIFTYFISSIVSCIIIAFLYGWELTLIIVSCTPVVIVSTSVIVQAQSGLAEKEFKYYSAAGKIAEEVLASIRTVLAFGGEKKEIDRYSKELQPTIVMGSKKGKYAGVGYGIMLLMMYLIYAIGFWYGIKYILEDRNTPNPQYTLASCSTIFFCISYAAQQLGYLFPHLEVFSKARVSATSIFKILSKKSLIDSFSTNGTILKNIKGEIEFINIHFNYPSRPDVKVLQGLNLKIKPGERVAIVGESGCGKSTLIQLVQRIYDPIQGTVLVDGNDISDLNVKSYRQHIGVVGQEPVLFATTIANNIALGNPTATQEQIEKAAIDAQCHDFIIKLPKGYDTYVGENSSQLSGGQKQRIAIARALVRKPTILLLDEATSALDSLSEVEVQKTLDNIKFNCTTLIVSHRLSTIKNVDRIVYIKDGVVAEIGTCDELLNKKQHYYNMVTSDTPNIVEKKEKACRRLSFNQMNMEKDLDYCSVEKESNEIQDDKNITLWKIIKLSLSEWPYLLSGTLAAVLVGISYNVFAFLYGETYKIYSIQDKEEMQLEANKYTIYFSISGILAGVVAFIEAYTFNMIGVKLTTRMRVLCFGSMLQQEIEWYEEAKNNVGALCARLYSDAAGIQDATGTWLSTGLQGLSSLIFGTGVALFYSWKLTVVSVILVPILFIPIYLELRITNDSGIEEKRKLESATKIAVEAISNIRTVQSLGQEKYFMDKYLIEIEKAYKAILKKSRFRGIIFSFGQAATYLGYVLCLWYGGILIAKEELDYTSVIIISETFVYSAWLMGLALAFIPNLNSAKISAKRIFQLLERNPKISSLSNSTIINNWEANGEIEFSKIKFSYHTRPEIKVLDDLDLLIPAGSTVALIGESGCGKSTCIQLLQRLYDPTEGSISLDKKNIAKTISLPLLRSQLGIVSQEPVLFDRTIAENIAYGDNNRQVTQEEIIEAAKNSNIHSFITTLPLGYETKLGARGTQLSGGQKQRIAIARALIRNPRVLLLDEATSALDQQSEKVVQVALDKACEGRTCIIITHRLSTVRNADVICVLAGGKIVEKGSHHELIAFGGIYSHLYNI